MTEKVWQGMSFMPRAGQLHSELKIIFGAFNFFEPGYLFGPDCKSFSIGQNFVFFFGGKHGKRVLSTQTSSLLTHKSACKVVFVCIYECCFMFRKRVMKMFRICWVFIVLCQLICSYTSMIDCRNESKFFLSVGVVFVVWVDRCLNVVEQYYEGILHFANCYT